MIKSDLKADEIEKTIASLKLRIIDRFPDSGLSKVCEQLHEISKDTKETCDWINSPNHVMRWSIIAAIVFLVVILVFTVAQIPIRTDGLSIADIFPMTEAALNELVLIGAGIFFMVTLDTRRKRKRVVTATNRLRSIAHIIDAHQLTKDPDGIAKISSPTTHSPKRDMNEYELGRYLDYCTEMLSLTGKLGFLYIQHFSDPLANNAVNELEDLTTALSRKIWQKIIILHNRGTRN